MPAIRPVKALGSLSLVTHANIPSKVITELAYITDERLNTPERPAGSSGDSIQSDAPLDVSFEEFMNGVNSRGKNTKAKQRKMTAEQADAILLVMVQKGHVELIVSQDDPSAIETIRILPEAKKILAAFLPKLRGYGDVPYDQEYRGAIALAKRHFFPRGRAPTKRELMGLLLQSYQERRELRLRLQAPVQRPTMRTLSIQTNLAKIETGVPSDTGAADDMEEDQPVDSGPFGILETVDQQGDGSPQNDDIEVDIELANPAAPPANQSSNNEDREMSSELEREPAAPIAPCTPAPTRYVNPYMTPVSNPRRGDHARAVPPDPSPTPSTSAAPMVFPDIGCCVEDSVRDELLQATATYGGALALVYARYEAEVKRTAVLEGNNKVFKRDFNRVQRKLHKTELQLRESNTKTWMITQWVKSVFEPMSWIWGQVGNLNGMLDSWNQPTTGSTDDTDDTYDTNTEEWVVHDAQW